MPFKMAMSSLFFRYCSSISGDSNFICDQLRHRIYNLQIQAEVRHVSPSL